MKSEKKETIIKQTLITILIVLSALYIINHIYDNGHKDGYWEGIKDGYYAAKTELEQKQDGTFVYDNDSSCEELLISLDNPDNLYK